MCIGSHVRPLTWSSTTEKTGGMFSCMTTERWAERSDSGPAKLSEEAASEEAIMSSVCVRERRCWSDCFPESTQKVLNRPERFHTRTHTHMKDYKFLTYRLSSP